MPLIKNTVVADFSAPQGLFKFSLGRQLSSTPGHGTSFSPAIVKHLRRLGGVRARVWIEFDQAYDLKEREPRYSNLGQYLERWRDLSNRLLLNWRSNYEHVLKGEISVDEMRSLQVEMMAYYKALCPTIEWVEAENEPSSSMVEYYTRYQFITSVVNEVNARNLPGPSMGIGGPTINTFDEEKLWTFLNCYRDDNTSDKRLDFIAYHQYLFGRSDDPLENKDFPAMVKHERDTLENMLKEYSLEHIPAFVSETGFFPIDRASSRGFNYDLHIQAAGMAAMDYFYVQQSRIIPFHWTVIHPDNGRKNYFANQASDGIAKPDLLGDVKDGTPRPFYLLSLMQTLLPNMRFYSSTHLCERGLGVGTLAGGDHNKVAVLSWNYQWSHDVTHDIQLEMVGLPEAFKRNKVRVLRYRIAPDKHHGSLDDMKVEDDLQGPLSSGSYSHRALHEPNAVRLTLLSVVTDSDGAIG
ncbi:hypothetical protein [Pseudomonas putida]|uniref:hypothetical protein n=1 Tax=Pseudomonas putida TaxID=303 RepID=UPI0005B9BF9B|nr:hypothetical protein [Pseudomonas putida]